VKWYLSLVLVVFLGAVGYRLFVMVRWTPSVETLSRTIAVRAPVLWGPRPPSGGRISFDRDLWLDGRLITCRVGSRGCESSFSSLRDGEFVDANLVLVPNEHGGRWLAMTMHGANVSFTNSPQSVAAAWKSDERGQTVLAALSIVFFLLIFPASASPGFRRAWWAMLDSGGRPGDGRFRTQSANIRENEDE
jgi:hypothetical protein